MEPLLRRSARVLPVNRKGEVLLLFGHDPARPDEPYWFSIGGGAEPGETPRTAAVRELSEETGIDVPAEQLIGPIHQGLHLYSFDGVDYRGDAAFFALALDDIEVSFSRLDEGERGHIRGSGWWRPEVLSRLPLSNPGLAAVAGLAADAVAGNELSPH